MTNFTKGMGLKFNDLPIVFFQQNVNISFIENKAGLSGAAIFASDLLLCQWIGNEYANGGDKISTIFGNLPEEIADMSPFYYRCSK